MIDDMELTRKQLAARKDKAVRFVRDVLDDSDRAGEIEDESLDHYADRRKIRLLNPRKTTMAKKAMTKDELQARVAELEEENDALQAQLDQVADIVAPSVEDDEDDDEEDDDSYDEDDDSYDEDDDG